MKSTYTAATLLCAKPCLAENGATDLTDALNQMISSGSNGVYSGGSGVMVRAEDFEDAGNSQVVASTFWSNDLYMPSQFYPTAGNPWFPNENWDGFGTITDWMTPDEPAGADGPWTYAALGVVVGSGMSGLYPEFENIQKDDWGWGVFYATDSNAADKRCHWWDDNQGYDCPGGWLQDGSFMPSDDFQGAGSFPMGNPESGSPGQFGGGAGCHFETGAQNIDQQDSDDSENLVQSYQCECNYNFKADWSDWVWNFINSAKQKPGFEDRSWLHGGDKAPQWGMDSAICWVNNPRDMIQIQNQIYWLRSFWNNALIPKADWSSSDPSELRKYWGWNEVPASREFMDNPMNWDTIMVKLPAAVCNNADGDMGKTDMPQCLGDKEAVQLELDLDQYVSKQKLQVGAEFIDARPGSSIVFVREYGNPYTDDAGQQQFNWQREFFCANWQSPSGMYAILHSDPDTAHPKGACYLDRGTPAPSPAPSPPSTTIAATAV